MPGALHNVRCITSSEGRALRNPNFYDTCYELVWSFSLG